MTEQPTYTSKFPELAFYGLPGHTRNPRDVLKQAQDGEELGLGSIVIGERADYKETASICGAIAAVTEKIFFGTSATNLHTRHPLVTASMITTLDKLSHGRYAIGCAKGNNPRWKAMGIEPLTFEREREYLDVIRRLIRGETIKDYKGKIGEYTKFNLADGEYFNADVPFLYVGFGPKGLEHAGQHYEGTHFHTFFGEKALKDSIARVRTGEKIAGRKEGTVKNWSVLATACDVSDEQYLKFIIARLVTYLQLPGYGEMLVKINGWDLEKLEEIRQHPSVTTCGGLVDAVATPQQVAEIEKIVPMDWRPAAVGTAKECAQTWVQEFERGADGIIIHASTPEEFAPVLSEYERIRPAHLFEGRTNRPA